MPTTYKVLSNILLSRLIPYAKEIIGDHQCGFQRNRSTIDHIFCIRQILEKKWEYSEPVHQLFIDFKKAYDPVRTEVLYKILIEFGIPRKLVRLIKMSLTETYRVIQEESALLWEMIVWVILSKEVHTNMGPILNAYGVMGIF